MESMEEKYDRNNIGKLNQELGKMHEEELGFEIPEGFFTDSKSDILNKVSANQNSTKVVSLFNNKVFWIAAASVILLLVFSIFKTSSLEQIDQLPTVVVDTLKQINNDLVATDNELSENDVLVSSLFIDDADVDEFADSYMMGDLAIEEPDYN